MHTAPVSSALVTIAIFVIASFAVCFFVCLCILHLSCLTTSITAGTANCPILEEDWVPIYTSFGTSWGL